MKVAVLDYTTGTLYILEVPKGIDPEDFILDEFSPNQIEWMELKSISMDIKWNS